MVFSMKKNAGNEKNEKTLKETPKKTIKDIQKLKSYENVWKHDKMRKKTAENKMNHKHVKTQKESLQDDFLEPYSKHELHSSWIRN